MFGLNRKAKILREAFVAGSANTGNVTATVGTGQPISLAIENSVPMFLTNPAPPSCQRAVH
jgi:hypothetical protein